MIRMMDSPISLSRRSHVENGDLMNNITIARHLNTPQQRQAHPHVVQYGQPHDGKVDSWRSYRNGTDKLQYLSGSASSLNATAQAFVPAFSNTSPTNTNHTSSEALRASDRFTAQPILEVTNRMSVHSIQSAKPTSQAEAEKNHKKGKKARKPTRFNTVLEQAPSTSNELSHKPPVPPTPQFASRYPVRSNRGQASEVIPSIETDGSVGLSELGKVLQVLGDVRKSTHRVTSRATKSPDAPASTPAYRESANIQPKMLSAPRKLLVILDLNGTLLYRTRVGNKKVHMRPGVKPFLDYLFANHVVMVYTSTMPQTAQAMVGQFLHPSQRALLAALWARDKLDLTKDQFYSKVQVYKKLDKVWKDEAIQKTAGPGNKWDQSNTVLIDDSKEKALAQPHNLLQVPEYSSEDDPARTDGSNTYARAYTIQQDIVRQLELKLERLSCQDNVSRLIRQWQEDEVSVPRLPGQEVVIEEDVDQKNVKFEQNADATVRATLTHLPTPDSLDDQECGGVYLKADTDEEDVASARSRSVSPIDESIFKELLEGTGK